MFLRRRIHVSDEREKKSHGAQDEDSGQDDVEAHKKLHAQNDEANSDDDDVEAHAKVHKDA